MQPTLPGIPHSCFSEDPAAADLLVLVDGADTIRGYAPKSICHQGDGLLHRAFSIFIFTTDCRLLIQKRSSHKPLWPGYWSNSACSHPRKDEDYLPAASRRLPEELNINTPLHFLYKFQYRAAYQNIGSENEMCAVFFGITDSHPQANSQEISDWRYISPINLDYEMQTNPDAFSPWFKIEWHQIRTNFMPIINNTIAGSC